MYIKKVYSIHQKYKQSQNNIKLGYALFIIGFANSGGLEDIIRPRKPTGIYQHLSSI